MLYSKVVEAERGADGDGGVGPGRGCQPHQYPRYSDGSYGFIQTEHLKKKEDDKKSKNYSISHELYQSIQRDVISLFTKKSDMHKSEEIEDDRT